MTECRGPSDGIKSCMILVLDALQIYQVLLLAYQVQGVVLWPS